MQKNKTILGGVMFAGSYCIVAVVYAVAKYVQSKWGFSTSQVACFNFTVVTLCALPWVVRNGGVNALRSDKYFLLSLRGVLGFGMTFLGFKAANLLPLVDAVTLLNTAPLWIAIIATFTLKERLSWKSILCIIGGFVGMLIVVHPRLHGMSFTGDLFALVASLCLAASIIVRRDIRSEPWQRILFYYGVIGAMLSAFVMIAFFKMPQGIQWVFFAVMGVLLYFAQKLATIALHYAKASVLGPLTYSSIVVSGIIGWLVWGHIPTFLTVLGILIIVISGVLILIFDARKKHG